MRIILPFLLSVLLLTSLSAVFALAENGTGDARHGRLSPGKRGCDSGPAWCKSESGTCRAEMHGRCGKRRGDWYGASQPVATVAQARTLLLNYFAGQEYTVSEPSEKKWGFRADIIDRNGKVIDRVMIDKRTGRIRSLY